MLHVLAQVWELPNKRHSERVEGNGVERARRRPNVDIFIPVTILPPLPDPRHASTQSSSPARALRRSFWWAVEEQLRCPSRRPTLTLTKRMSTWRFRIASGLCVLTVCCRVISGVVYGVCVHQRTHYKTVADFFTLSQTHE